MNYKIGDRVIIHSIPIYSDISKYNKEYFINKRGIIIDVIEHIYQSSKYFDINISGKIYTFYESDFVLDILYYRNLKLSNILDNDKV